MLGVGVMKPDGKKKTILEEVMAHLMGEGMNLINMQACPVPSFGDLEGKCFPRASACFALGSFDPR